MTSTTTSFALYERTGAVGTITLNRPERLNAISGSLTADFLSALRTAIADEECAVMVLKGAGRAFCAGDDLKEFHLQTETPEAIVEHIGTIQEVTRLMMGCDKPIVGAIHGYAVGGGFEWMLNCDLVVAADDLVAFLPEMDWGQFVTGGVTHLLPIAVGHHRAMELMMLGERQTAHRLEQLGLVNLVVPRDDMEAKAYEWAAVLAKKSRWSLSRLKKLVNSDLGEGLWRALELEQTVTVEAFAQPDVADRVAGFLRRKG